MELNKLTIKEVALGLRNKDFSCVELTKSCLDEIGKRDKELNTFITVDESGAIDSARVVDGLLSEERDLHLLAGIPVAVKDIFNTKGIKSTCGSLMLKNFTPPYDASVVEKLRGVNMVMVGKTNMDEFACGASTEHSCFGVTRNPFDVNRVAGGSSGGSAAALAADMCLYALGTDTGGSIRQPASFCGVYGLKVTYGRVSRSGVTSMASSWDTVGHFARCVEDVAIILQVIAGKDRRDSTTSPVAVPDYSKFLNMDVKGLKIGVPKEYFDEGIDSEVSEIVKNQISKLESHGALVYDVSLPYTRYAVAVYYLTMPAELSANLERFDGIRYGTKSSSKAENLVDYYFKSRGNGFGDEIKRRIMIGTYALSAGYYDAYYKKAMCVRTKIMEDFDKAFKKLDVLIAPVSPFTAFKVGELVDDPLAMYMSDALTIPCSAAGIPSLACPAGMDSKGLPVGLQIMAPQFEEGRCLRVASFLEKL